MAWRRWSREDVLRGRRALLAVSVRLGVWMPGFEAAIRGRAKSWLARVVVSTS
jgi:hypothetical protein